jgi:hypothetical protein
MARSLNIVIGANIEKLRAGFNDAISVIKKAGGEMSADVAKSAKSIEERLAAIATRNPTMGTVRQLTQLAMEARALGPEFAASADQFIREAGRIKDSIGDARAEVGYFASDTRRLDAVLGGVQAVAGAFSAVEGATAMLGIKSEDLQKTMAQLQGAIALVNGVQAIQNALQAESALMVGLQTAATRIQAYVMGQATVAARAYSIALLATGAGAIIVGIGLVAAAISSVSKESKKATEEVDNLTDAYKKSAKRAKETSEIAQEISDELLKKELDAAKLKGASDAELAKVEINFLQKRKANHLAMLAQLKKGTAEHLQYQRDISAIQHQIDEVTTQSQIKNAEKRREKKKELLKKEFDDAIDAIHAKHSGEVQAEEFRIKQYQKQEERKRAIIEESKKLTAKNLQAGTANTPVYLDVKVNPVSYSKAAKDIEKMTQALNSAFATLQTDAAASFGQFLGDLATGEKEAGKNFGKNMLGAIASFMDSLGKALIATAVASEAFQKLVLTNPAAAAAAGIALIAGATIVRNSLKQGPEVKAFAEGGIVSGPTLGLVGEYPGASSNPEVIAPLDKLKGMLNTNDQSGFVASTTIQGRDLAIVLERYNKDSRRG